MSGERYDKYELDSKLHHEGRKVVMIVDNCPAHPRIENLKTMTVVFLPKNTPSITQPMDQGVIPSLKAKSEMPTFKNQMRAKCKLSEPVSQFV